MSSRKLTAEEYDRAKSIISAYYASRVEDESNYATITSEILSDADVYLPNTASTYEKAYQLAEDGSFAVYDYMAGNDLQGILGERWDADRYYDEDGDLRYNHFTHTAILWEDYYDIIAKTIERMAHEYMP